MMELRTLFCTTPVVVRGEHYATRNICAVGGASGSMQDRHKSDISLNTYGTSGCPSEVEYFMKASRSAARDELFLNLCNKLCQIERNSYSSCFIHHVCVPSKCSFS